MSLLYGLHKLDWLTFERTIQALLKVVVGAGVSSFGGSKDGGRDATFSGQAPFPSNSQQWDGEWLFQVKHSANEKLSLAQFSKFSSSFSNELTRTKKRHPNIDNYVLLLSFALTAAQKDALSASISKHFKNTALLDGNDVCGFLQQYPHIRTAVPHLLTLEDLNLIVHSDHFLRAEAFHTHWSTKLTSFIATSKYFSALDILLRHHFIVLDGPPEVGKSTMGAAMALALSAQGFLPYTIHDPSHFFELYQHDISQVFFVDDALGSINYESHLGDAWARDLTLVLSKLDKHHNMIWTSRRYILQGALDRSKLVEVVDDFPGDKDLIIGVGDISPIEKAQMFYSHAIAEQLPLTARQFLKTHAPTACKNSRTTPERIRRIIQDISHLPGSSQHEDEYMQILVTNIQDPGIRFKRAFDNLQDAQRELLIALMQSDHGFSVNDLKRIYEAKQNDV